MRSAAILIATRPDSKRLPGKVFKRIGGLPAIEHILRRLIGCDIPIWLCVPYGCQDYNYLFDQFKKDLKLKIYFGNPESPLHRMADCVAEEGIKENFIIRITHDDILIDQKTMLDMLDKASGELCGYAISPEIVDGAGVEIIRRENLQKAAIDRQEPTEYVSYFVKSSPFSKQIKFEPRSSVCRKYRLTMDYEEDFILLDMILKQVGALAPLDRVVEFIDQNPHVLNVNRIPTTTIYTCTYNSVATIHQTISSVLNANNESDFEYIIVDDGSTDNTLVSASRYLTNNRKIKLIVNEKNEGLASSSNKALNAARGNYVMRVDADDWLISGALQTLKQRMDSDDAGIIYPSYYETDSSGNTLRNVLPNVHHHAGCALMDKKLINEIRFTSGIRHWDSLDLYNRIVNKGFKVSYYTGSPLWYYRKSANSMSAVMTPEREATLKQIGVS